MVTYGELNDESIRLARVLRAGGLVQGDHVAILVENHPRYLGLCWAAQRSGLYFTTLNTSLTADELAYIVGDCGAKALISSAALQEKAVAVAGTVPDLPVRLMLDGEADGFAGIEVALKAHAATPLPDEVEGSDMLYSSGTTGRPKGVKRPFIGAPFGAPSPLVMLTQGLFGFGEDTVYLSPAPLYHAAPLGFCMATHRLGGTAVVMEHFDAEEALRLVERHRVTHSQWVPTMFTRMLRAGDDVRHKYDLSSLRVAIHAAAPCPVPVKQAMIDWWGPILHEYYSGTEGNGFVYCNSEEWLAHPGTVGRSLLGPLHILDDGGQELPTGERGKIFFESSLSFEYHRDPEKTAGSRDPLGRGWTTLGDVGYLDEDGYLYLTDRQAFMIISGGVNIYPQEVETLLAAHPKVADVAVFGVPNAEFGEEVKAVIEPAAGCDGNSSLERELIDYCRARLSPVKCPRSVDFRPELPRLPTGKLLKQRLRDEYWEGRASRLL